MSGKGTQIDPAKKRELEGAIEKCKVKLEAALKEYEEKGKVNFKLNDNLSHLLWDEPFLARISRLLKKQPNYHIPTAAIVFRPDVLEFVFMYNPLFFAQLTAKQRKGIAQHELYHVALGHVTERNPEHCTPMRRNIAQDLAINSLPNVRPKLENLIWLDIKSGQVATGLMPGEGQYENLPPEKSMEWYLEHLPKDAGEGQGQGMGLFGIGGSGDPQQQQFDDHDNWAGNIHKDGEGGSGGTGQGSEDGEGENSLGEGISAEGLRRIAEHKMRDIVQRAVNETEMEEIKGGRGWGNVPVEIRKEIKEKLKVKLDPKGVITSFIKKSQRADRRKTMMRVNRRKPYQRPGRAIGHASNILLLIDASGSVSDHMLAKFFSWMDDLAKFATFTVGQFDTNVLEDSIFVWKKGQKKPIIRHVAGGTDFNAPTVYANERAGKFDGLIILTDMEAPEPERCVIQRMWITDKDHFNQPYYRPRYETFLCVD